MLHIWSVGIMGASLGLWLFFGLERVVRFAYSGEYTRAVTEICVLAVYFFGGTALFVFVVLYLVPVTVEHPDPVQAFLLLCVPLILFGRFLHRFLGFLRRKA